MKVLQDFAPKGAIWRVTDIDGQPKFFYSRKNAQAFAKYTRWFVTLVPIEQTRASTNNVHS
jgi:hypothetical protein